MSSNLNILLNYYIQNSYLNLTNTITNNDLILLLNEIKKLNIHISHINIPKNFKYIDIIKEYLDNAKINNYPSD
jgi:hypothetical protein